MALKLKDAELDELWRSVGYYRNEMKKHLDEIPNIETKIFSITERVFREYRDLLADYEHDHEALEKLQADYQKLKASDPKAELQVFEKELSHLVSDTASFNLDRQSIANRVLDIRNKLRNKLYTLGYKGHF